MNQDNYVKSDNSYSRMIVFMFAIATFCCVSGYRGVLNYIAAFFVLAILTLSLIQSNGKIRKDTKTLCIIFFMIFYTLTSFINLDLEYFITYFIYNILIFSPVVMCNIIIRTQNDYIVKKTLKYTIAIWVLIGIITLVTSIISPSIARQAAAYQEQFSGRIFGGYNYAFGSALLLVYLFSNILRGNIKGIMRGFAITLCALLFVVIYLTESTLTTFASIIGIVVCVFIDGRDILVQNVFGKLIKIVFFVALLFLGYSILKQNVDAVMMWINRRSDTLFFYRIGEILRSFFYSDTTGHVELRSSLITTSWGYFCQSPLLGWGYKYGNVFSLGKEMGIGNHSEIFDTLARYGIIGGLPLFMIYINGVKPFIKNYIGVLSTLLILMLFNPFMTFSSFLILFYVIPLFEYCRGNEQYKKVEN